MLSVPVSLLPSHPLWGGQPCPWSHPSLPGLIWGYEPLASLGIIFTVVIQTSVGLGHRVCSMEVPHSCREKSLLVVVTFCFVGTCLSYFERQQLTAHLRNIVRLSSVVYRHLCLAGRALHRLPAQLRPRDRHAVCSVSGSLDWAAVTSRWVPDWTLALPWKPSRGPPSRCRSACVPPLCSQGGQGTGRTLAL